MLWKYVQKKVKNSLYPDLHYWQPDVPRPVQRSIYKKYGLNIKFETIPEHFSPFFYEFYFGIKKGYYYPTDDHIKFFYFSLFKRNGFIFILICCIIYRNCFLELLFLVIKSGIVGYLVISVIYISLHIHKRIRLTIRFLYKLPVKYYPILIIILINCFLNKLFNSKKEWYF